VHLYGGFDFVACKSVIVGKAARSKAELLGLKIAESYAVKTGKSWANA